MANGDWNDQWPPNAANAVRYIKPVCSFPANQFGLADMVGNVWEWCRDWYDERYYATMPSRDPCNDTPNKYANCRGGAYSCSPAALRPAFRNTACPPSGSDSTVGFRCVATP